MTLNYTKCENTEDIFGDEFDEDSDIRYFLAIREKMIPYKNVPTKRTIIKFHCYSLEELIQTNNNVKYVDKDANQYTQYTFSGGSHLYLVKPSIRLLVQNQLFYLKYLDKRYIRKIDYDGTTEHSIYEVKALDKDILKKHKQNKENILNYIENYILPEPFNIDIINQIISTDHKYRYEGVEIDLFNETSIIQQNLNLKTDNSVVICTSRYQSSNPLHLNPIEYKQHMLNFRGINLDELKMDNILIAGGSICSYLIHGHINFTSDIDIFLYDMNKKEALQKVRYLFNFFNNQTPIMAASLSKNSFSFTTANKNKVDIILRLYKTKSEILHGFDIGASAVGWDGTHFLFTTLSKFTFENRSIIVDVTRRSLTFECRLIKYCRNYAFNLIFPDWDISLMKASSSWRKNLKWIYSYSLPFLNIYSTKFREINLNTSIITDCKFSLKTKEKNLNNIICDYKQSKFFANNINALLTNNLENIYKMWSYKGVPLTFDTIYAQSTTLDKDSIIERYEKIVKTFKVDTWINTFRTLLIYKHFFINPDVIIQHIVTNTIDESVLPIYFQKIFDSNIKIITDSINTINATPFTLNWKTENTMTQLTSSVHFIVTTPIEWYGQYFNTAKKRSRKVKKPLSEYF